VGILVCLFMDTSGLRRIYLLGLQLKGLHDQGDVACLLLSFLGLKGAPTCISSFPTSLSLFVAFEFYKVLFVII
jgi:hypothetical protein